MSLPKRQHMTLIGGEDNTTYTANKINVGETIKISGSESNDGIYTIVDIVLGSQSVLGAGKDVHYVLKGRGLTDEDNSDVEVTISAQQNVGDKLVVLGSTDESAFNQLQQIDSNFEGANSLSDTNWVAAPAPNQLTLAVVQGGTDPQGFLTSGSPWLYCIGTTGAFDREYATLDGAHWESNLGLSNESMIEGRVYTFQFDLSYSADGGTGGFSVGLCDNSFNLSDGKGFTVAGIPYEGFGRFSFDFTYDASIHQKIIVNVAINSTNVELRVDNISIIPVDKIAGGIDIWSYSNSTSNSSGVGWNRGVIRPTLSGSNNKYIYHFADEALRVMNTNDSNPSYVKWFGYIQRNQFALSQGLAFNEWQQHPNTLLPPVSDGQGLSFSYLTSSHTVDTLDNYHRNHTNITRGVTYRLANSVSTLRINHPSLSTISESQEFMSFRDSGGTAVNDQLISGEVISATSNGLTVRPSELLLVQREAHNFGAIRIDRGYGGTTPRTYSDGDNPILVRGAGFNIAVTEDTTQAGLWIPSSWEFYQTFIYDEKQESLPVQISDGAASLGAGTLDDTTGNYKFKVTIYADIAYNGRISGGRIYIREKNSREPLTLFADIDIVNGVRLSLIDNYSPWQFNDTNRDGFYVTDLFSEGPNIDTYTSLNGFSSEEDFIAIGKQGEGYKTSIVTNRRTYIANLKLRNKNNEIKKYGDRIMYSELNKFDTFLGSNYIDVSVGDFGEYIALHSYADRLLAFKHNTIHVINVGNPNPASWFLEESLDNIGITHIFNVCTSKFGIVWVNETGCYIYDGKRIANLIDNKINTYKPKYGKSWNDFVLGSSGVKDVMVGFDSFSNSLIVLRSPNDSSDESNLSFVYDFNNATWSFSDGIIERDGQYLSNFIYDYNNNLVLAREGSSVVNFSKYLPVSSEQSGHEFVTADIDYGEPGLTKKVFSIRMTYKNTVADFGNVLSYSIDGKGNFETIQESPLPTSFEVATGADGYTGVQLAEDLLISYDTSDGAQVDVSDASRLKVGDILKIGNPTWEQNNINWEAQTQTWENIDDTNNPENLLITRIEGNTIYISRQYHDTAQDVDPGGTYSHLTGEVLYVLRWKTKTYSLTQSKRPIKCQSIQFKLNSTVDTALYIDDITIEWRPISGGAVSNG